MEAGGVVLEQTRRQRMVCRVTLGLTIYLDHAPTRDEVMRAYDAYRTICPEQGRRLVKTTRMIFWDQLHDDDREQIRLLLEDQDRRRDQGVVVWDGHEGSQWSFWMQGFVPPDGRPSASFCQVFVPDDAGADTLLKIARRFADEIEVLSGHGGFTTLFDANHKGAAFNQLYAWGKRFLGLDIEDLNRTLPFMLNSVKGANWLTLIGTRLWSKLVQQAGREPAFEAPIFMEVGRKARIIQAGLRPVLGDRNRGEFPDAYATVERVLSPLKVRDHPEFVGRFGENNETTAWLLRLTEPERW